MSVTSMLIVDTNLSVPEFKIKTVMHDKNCYSDQRTLQKNVVKHAIYEHA